VIWLALALCTGVGFLAYLAAWIIMPKETLGAAPGVEYAREGAT
jgi:phage shock protein PspC (stress-responsive transcriptional regulator)